MSQLAITLTRSGAAAGVAGGYTGFRNRSVMRCRLEGWPTLTGVTASGKHVTAVRLLTTEFGPNGLTRPPVVTLAPGMLAEAAFESTDTPGPSGVCPPPLRYLRITPPGSTSTVQLSGWLPYLHGYMPECAAVSVSPVVPSADLYDG